MFRAALVDDRAINQIISEQFPGVQVSRECYLEVSGDWNKRLCDYVITGPSLKFIDPVQFALFHLQRLRRDNLTFSVDTSVFHVGALCFVFASALICCLYPKNLAILESGIWDFCTYTLELAQRAALPRILEYVHRTRSACLCTLVHHSLSAKPYSSLQQL